MTGSGFRAALLRLIERLIPYDPPTLDDERLRALERRLAAVDAQVEQRRYVLERERQRGEGEGHVHER